MNCNDVKQGMRIKTNAELGETAGMMVGKTYIHARKASTPGIVKGFVPGHGGDVWWIEHEAGNIAVYCFDEFEPITE